MFANQIMLKFLLEPYPFHYERTRVWRLSLTLGVSTLLFLYLFRPVGIERGLVNGLFVTCVVYGVIAAGLFFLYFQALPLLLRGSQALDNWTVMHEMVTFAGLFLLAGLVNTALQPWLYASDAARTLHIVVLNVGNTFLVGFLIFGVLTAVNFNYLLRGQEEKAALLRMILHGNKQPTEAASVATGVKVVITAKHEQFSIDPETLLYVMADGNYVEVFERTEQGVQRHLRRIPLRSLEAQLANRTQIMQVHRAYLVNVRAIEQITGNAQGYQLRISGTEHLVPVSRSFMDSFNRAISQLKS